MLQVAKIVSLNTVLSYIVYRASIASGADFASSIVFGIPYIVIMLGFAPNWFDYKGDNPLVKFIWAISFIPGMPLLVLFWMLA